MPTPRPAPGPLAHEPADPAAALVLDLLAWLAPGARPYGEVMDRWRSHCPRLTVWEDAVDAGLVARCRVGAAPAMVALTPLGRRRLNAALASQAGA